MYAIKIKYYYHEGTFNALQNSIICVTPDRESANLIADAYRDFGSIYRLACGEYSRPEIVVFGVNTVTASQYKQYASYQDWLQNSEDGVDKQMADFESKLYAPGE